MALAHRLPRRFTYADYCRWPDDQRWELIDGAAWDMSPAPSTAHQEVSTRLLYLFYGHFRERGCRVFAAPVDVLLPAGDEADEAVETVVQPDLVVVCDPEKVREANVRGAPDLVVEILSPSTVRKDEGIKRERYQRAGVAEYWLVHPVDHVVHRYVLVEESYRRPEVFGPEDGSFASSRFPELSVDLVDLFGVEPKEPRQPPSAG
jgi:Uma2 family endonuclease